MRRILVGSILLLCVTTPADAAKVLWSSRAATRVVARPTTAVTSDSVAVVTHAPVPVTPAPAAPTIARTPTLGAMTTPVKASPVVTTPAPVPSTAVIAPLVTPAVPKSTPATPVAPPTSAPAVIAAAPVTKLAEPPSLVTASVPAAPVAVKPVAVTAPIVPTLGADTEHSHVSYLAGPSAYLDAGSAQGLQVGDTVVVRRDGVAIAALRVAFTSSRRASCDTLWTHAKIAVGDEVRWRRDATRIEAAAIVAVDADSVRAVAVLATPKGRPAARGTRTRGRVGARWLSVDAGAAGSYRQPGLELRLDSRDAFGGHVDAALDVRGRRTLRTTASGNVTEQLSRVYRASTTIRDADDHRRLTLGRQTSPTLASVSLFDGALLEWASPTRTIGVFTGRLGGRSSMTQAPSST